MKNRLPYTYDPDTCTATCRTCLHSQCDLLPEQAGPWHAGHLPHCTGTPTERPSAKLLEFRPRKDR